METQKELTDFLQTLMETADLKGAVKETIESHPFTDEELDILTLNDVLEMYKSKKEKELSKVRDQVCTQLMEERDQIITKQIDLASKSGSEAAQNQFDPQMLD